MIDLRSDTVTRPTPAMREAMANAAVGDDVYGDDPTVNELEALAASTMGKEAALFVPSGTMGNQLALMTHCKRGDEVILHADCHIVQHEVGAAAVLSGVTLNPVRDVTAAYRGRDIHTPDQTLLCLENATGGGTVLPLDVMRTCFDGAKERGLAVHLDGARIFNAAVTLNCTAAGIAAYCDSVMFCLSKGLCAPVGSMLCGDAAFIGRARKFRKLLGGGMRQAGILAAAGIIAVRDMAGRLAEDHKRARYLAHLLDGIPGLTVDASALDINMVYTTLDGDSEAMYEYLLSRGINTNGVERLVTHRDVSDADIEAAARAIRGFFV